MKTWFEFTIRLGVAAHPLQEQLLEPDRGILLEPRGPRPALGKRYKLSLKQTATTTIRINSKMPLKIHEFPLIHSPQHRLYRIAQPVQQKKEEEKSNLKSDRNR